jgi:glycosyltransferase involved in cell wall biosynthesis
MFDNRKVTVVMPAFNAASTPQIAYVEVMTQAVVDLIILVGDASHDSTCRHSRTKDKVRVNTSLPL